MARHLGLTICLLASLAATPALSSSVRAQTSAASSSPHHAVERDQRRAVAKASDDDPRIMNPLRPQEQGWTCLRPSLMRHSAALLQLSASATLALDAAEPTYTAAQAVCEAKRLSCVAECRARHFAIDPKRDACIANCMAEANRCMREQAAQRG